jgi:transcriptional regulator of arginine metabolism
MKNNRQSLILDIIAKEAIETQEQLLERLRQRGVASTQATISRDIKQGTYKYAVSHSRAHLNIADKLRTIFHESITSVEAAQNIVVFKTLAGLAGGACEALDHMDINGIVGTLAGENTVFVVMRDNASAETFCQEIQEML